MKQHSGVRGCAAQADKPRRAGEYVQAITRGDIPRYH